MKYPWPWFATMGCAIAVLAQTAQPLPEWQPAWRQMLLPDSAPARNIGWQSLRNRSLTGLAFMEDGRLVVYGVSPAKPALGGRGKVGSAWALRLVWYDPAGGALTSKVWPVAPVMAGVGRDFANGVYASRGGLLVQANETVFFLSNQLEPIRAWKIPEGLTEPSNPLGHRNSTGWMHAGISVSPSRKTVVIYQGTEGFPGTSRICALDGGTFALWRCRQLDYSIPPWGWARPPVSDEWLIAFGSVSPLGGSAVHAGCNPATPATESDSTACIIDGRPTGIQVLLDHGLYLGEFQTWPNKSPFSLALGSFSGGGTVLLTGTKAEYLDRFAPIRVDEGGALVAANVLRVHPGSIFWDIGDKELRHRIVIFDLNTKSQAATTAWLPPPKYNFDFALSPDGAHLAILQDDWVTMYDVPPPTPRPPGD